MTHPEDVTITELEPVSEMKPADHLRGSQISVDSMVSCGHIQASEITQKSPRHSSAGSLQLSPEIVNPRLSFTQDVLESLHSSKQPSPTRSPTHGHNAATNLERTNEARETADGNPPISSTGPATTDHDDDPAPDPPIYPSRAKTALIMFSLYLSIFLVALDRTILGPAIPAITNEFGSIADIGWYGSAYMLTACGFTLPYGRLYALFPTKPVFLSGIALFEAGSAVCGAAGSSPVLIAGRAVQGLGSSAVFTGAVLILARTVPLHRRPPLQGLFGACFGLASVAGPLLGGALTASRASWRWCFYVNLPVGGLAALAVALVLRLPDAPRQDREGTGRRRRHRWRDTAKDLDPLGALLFLPSVACLLLALQWGGTSEPWGAPRVVALLVASAVLLLAFAAWQYRTRHTTATVPARVLLQRSVAMGGLSQFCVGAAMLAFATYVPLWFQAVRGADAMQSGVDTLPLVLSVVVGSVACGALVPRRRPLRGYYAPCMILGSGLMAAGAALAATRWDARSPAAARVGFQALLGLGVGCAMQQPNLAVQVVLPAADVPTGTALLAVCQTLGGAVFVAVGQNLFLGKFTSALEAIGGGGGGGGIDVARVVRSGATDLTRAVPADLLPEVLEAYNDSLTRGPFFAAMVVACVAIPAALGMEWRSVREGMPEKKGGDEEESSSSSVLMDPEPKGGNGGVERGIGGLATRDGLATVVTTAGGEVREKEST